MSPPGLDTAWPRAAILAIVLMCPPTDSAAQNPVELRGGIGLSSTAYDAEIVEAFNLSSRGWGVQGTFQPRFFGFANLLAELGFELWTKLCFSSNCSGDGNSTTSTMGSLGAGLSSPLLFIDDPAGRVGFGLFLNAGHEWIGAGLSDGSCLNCPIEGLRVNGGFWAEGGLDLVAHPTVSIGFAYRIYEEDAGMESRVTLRIIGYR